jgi:hypothetical protein
MSYRFLPWARRGLATRLTTPDPLTADPPARASIGVRLTVSTGDPANMTLRLYGPGDVIGVDPRGIVRTEPIRYSANFPPDQLVAIEFDAPDFPWLFTPAAAGAGDRLRPWLVLIVVAQQPGVDIAVSADRPLPALTIAAPAVPADELPDLTESWAWAHVHAVEAGAPPSVAEELASQPDRNVSRILCPRRLEPGRDYLACLVPAFEAGRLAGLGQTVPDAATTGPAWGGTGGVGATVTVPLYFHWQFRTGPAGDFESLARRLTPRPVPDTVGYRRMAITAAHPALPPVPLDAGGILKLEGALRAPDAGSGDPLPETLGGWITELTAVLNAPAQGAVAGAADGAEPVGPPVYGGRQIKVPVLDGTAPGWLTELNTDPRHRAAAGEGTAIVQLNQEAFMQAAWEQVGEVIAANALLDRARLGRELAQRIHARHVVAQGGEALLALTAPVHDRVVTGGQVLAKILHRSTLPTGTLDASFRRLASPRSVALTRAARVAGLPDPALAPVQVVGELAAGRRTLDILAAPPDGLVSSRLLDLLPAHPVGDVGREVGMTATVPAQAVVLARTALTGVRKSPPPAALTLRSDLAISGIVLASLATAVTKVAGAGAAGPILHSVLDAAVRDQAAAAFALGPEHRVDAVVHDESGTLAVRPVGGIRVAPFAPVTGPQLRRPPIAGLPAGGVLGGDGHPVIVLPLPVTDTAVVTRFSTAFTANRSALTVAVTSIIPAPAVLDLGGTQAILRSAVDPVPVIAARAGLAVRIGDRALLQGIDGIQVHQREPLDQVMVGPLIPIPLYGPLATADPDRLLPGIGTIPDDTVTMLETNPRFVEAFLIGANHEMNRELMWRRYPTDQRGTPFRRFWAHTDGKDDIGPIAAFDPAVALGAHSGADLNGSLVLLVRGQLLRRYPNATISAIPSHVDGSLNLDPSLTKLPVFWGRIDPDVTFVGFPLTREDVQQPPGWYFVIAEQPTEPRFGLDVPPDTGGGGTPASWSDADWSQVAVAPGEYLQLTGNPLAGLVLPIIAGQPARARFGGTSADLAAITFQRPFRAAIHSSEVIAGAAPPPGSPPPVRPMLVHATVLRPLAPGGGT